MIQGYVRTQPSGRISPAEQITSGVMENSQHNVESYLNLVIIPVKMEVIDIFLTLIDIILLVIPQNVRLRGG